MDRLTATEARVAGLAARGRSDAEIAAALQLSAPGVADHLHLIYRKLGLSSRTELAVLLMSRRDARRKGAPRP